MARPTQILDWWVKPWLRAGSSFGERAQKILALAGALVCTVLPAMILAFGIDGWLWHLTASVVLVAPAAMLAVDQLTEVIDRSTSARFESESARARRLSTPIRFAMLFVGLALGVLAAYLLVIAWPSTTEPPEVLLRDYRRSMVILTSVVLVLGAIGTILWYRAESFRLRASLDRSRFEVLSAQMQPHFLFNVLSSIKELLVEDPALAADAIQRVADLYRLILQVSKHPTVRLHDELRVVESYLAVERIRYGERLGFAIDVPEELREKHVPSLMVQTLVENAVKHGIRKARAGGHVRVSAQSTASGEVCISIENTGAPLDLRADGTGLANTRERLAVMYGGPRLFIGSNERSGTSVSLVVSGERIDSK